MTDTTGGWHLHLTCPCGVAQTFRAVVPSLVLDRVERAGWKLADDPIVRPVEHRDGLCVTCS